MMVYWTIGLLGIYFNEIWIKRQQFSTRAEQMNLKISQDDGHFVLALMKKNRWELIKTSDFNKLFEVLPSCKTISPEVKLLIENGSFASSRNLHPFSTTFNFKSPQNWISVWNWMSRKDILKYLKIIMLKAIQIRQMNQTLSFPIPSIIFKAKNKIPCTKSNLPQK